MYFKLIVGIGYFLNIEIKKVQKKHINLKTTLLFYFKCIHLTLKINKEWFLSSPFFLFDSF